MDFGLSPALFGLFAALSWGISDFLVGKAAQRFGASKAALLVNGFGAVAYLAAYFLFLRYDTTFTTDGLLFALIGSVSFGLAQKTFFKAMAYGPIGLVSAVSSTYPLVALFVGLLFFGAHLQSMQILGIVLVVGGVMVASGLAERKTSQQLGKGPLFAIGAACGWGVGIGFIAHATSLMSWQNVFLTELLVAPVVLASLLPFTKGKEVMSLSAFKTAAWSPLILAGAVIQTCGLLFLNLGIAAAPTASAVVVAVSSCYPALTIFLALTHLKEKIPLIPLLGGITGVIGVVILVLGG
jgi:drug/metabolite transporter (DMT)-like permease